MKYLVWMSDAVGQAGEIITALQSQDIEVEVVLLQDGVYLADKGNANSGLLRKLGVEIHALQSHVEERGISSRLVAGVNLVDYKRILELMMEKCQKVISI